MRTSTIYKTAVLASVILAFALAGAGCGDPADGRRTAEDTRAENRAAAEPAATDAPPEAAGSRVDAGALGSKAARELCYETDTGDFPVLRSQTFALEFEPFKGTCFVTVHNPEYDDPPMESEFAIYRGNKRIYEFPEPFNGVTAGCWVEAVAFQDLNGDGLIDIIVVGKCPAKTAPYQENMVYANTGKGFSTNLDANYRLSEMKTVRAVADHVRDNQIAFFK
ncbi:MAG TPA: hypothetical protein PKD11_10415 [Pyrinomonadaceae bacterium]|nr:hypothetical protein [Pyrinomonadaceae bacterium]